MLNLSDSQRMADFHFHLLLWRAVSVSDNGDNTAQLHPEGIQNEAKWAKHTRDFKLTLNWVWDLSGSVDPSNHLLMCCVIFPCRLFFFLRIILGILWGFCIIPSGNHFKWRLKRDMRNGTYLSHVVLGNKFFLIK